MPEFDPNQKSKFTIPKDVSDSLKLINELKSLIGDPNIDSENPPQGSTANGDNLSWVGKGGSLNPLEFLGKLDGLDKIKALNDNLINIISVLDVLLQLVNVLQNDYNNLYKALQFAIKALLQQVQDLLVSISSTGLYILPLAPDLSPLDPNYKPGGGFSALKKKISHALKNDQDPNRPTFNNDGDIVGGLVLALTAGTNYGAMIKDLRVLSKFIAGLFSQDKVRPPRNLQAIPGLWPIEEFSNETNSAMEELGNLLDLRDISVRGALSSVLNIPGPQALGVKLIWDPPEGLTGINWYMIHRSRTEKGTPVLGPDKEPLRTEELPDGSGGEIIMKFEDIEFNGGQPVIFSVDAHDSIFSEPKLEYIDYEVKNDNTYYYKVVPAFPDSDKFKKGESPEEFVDGGLASNIASTKASIDVCEPAGPFADLLETPEGMLNGIATGEPPYWYNQTLRGILGPQLDRTFKSLVVMLERLWGLVQTSNDHFDSGLSAIKDTLLKTRKILVLLTDVLESLRQLRLSGSAIALWIPPEKGGVKGFADRLNSAEIPDHLKSALLGIDKKKDKDGKVIEVDAYEQSSICDIYGGFVILGGVPGSDSFEEAFQISDADVEKIKNSASFANTKANYNKAKGDENVKKYLIPTLQFIGGIFGGSDAGGGAEDEASDSAESNT